jgi:hypothetical protein
MRYSYEYNARVYQASAEGGNRTLIPAKFVADPASAGRPKVYHSQHEGQDKITWSGLATRFVSAG